MRVKRIKLGTEKKTVSTRIETEISDYVRFMADKHERSPSFIYGEMIRETYFRAMAQEVNK